MADNIFQQPNLSVFGEPTTPVDYSGLTGATQGTVFDPLMQYLSAGATIASQKQAAENLAKQKEADMILQQQDAARGKEYTPSEYQKLLVAKQKADERGDTQTSKALQKRLDKLSAMGGTTGGTITLPDGTVINTGTSPVSSKTTIGAIEKEQLGAANLQASINDVRSAADAVPDDYWTVQGRVVGGVDDVLARFGKPRTKEEQKNRQAFIRMVSSAGRMFDDYRKQVTGAAAATRELEILKTRLPNADGYLNFDSKLDFYTKLDNLDKFNRAAMARLAAIKADGFEIVPNESGNLIAKNKNTGEYIDVSTKYPLEMFGFGAAESAPSSPAQTTTTSPTPRLTKSEDGVWRPK